MNVISIGTDINLTWDNHLLKSYNDSQHEYDKATTRRTQKQINGIQTKYWYNDSNQLIYEETGNEYIRYQYDLNRNLIRLVAKANNKIYKFNLKRDILENILGLIDENTKEEVIKYEYDSYEIVKISGSLKDIAFKLNTIMM